MNKKFLIGIGFAIIALIIAGLVLRPVLVPVGLVGVALISVWIFLLWMVQSRKAINIFEHMEPESAQTLLKRLKVLMFISGISLATGIIGTILHNALYGISEIEEPVTFFIAIVGLFLFVIITVVSLVVFLIGKRRTV